jgi:N-acetylneuraminic acid mutarotase
MKIKLMLSSVIVLLCPLLASVPSHAAPLTWHTRHPLPDSRFGSGAVPINGKLYLMGGSSNGSDAYNAVYSYDPALDQYAPKAPMPTGRYMFGATELNGKIYTLGGYPQATDLLRPSRAFEVYDPQQNSWSTQPDVPTEAGIILHAVTIHGKIYTLGTPSILSEYDPATQVWTQKAAMPTPRDRFSVAMVNDELYVIGGNDAVANVVEAYDPATDTWQEKAPMPTPREETGAAVVDGKIYVVGGYYQSDPGHVLDTVEVYDPATNTWNVETPLAAARYSVIMATLNGALYAMGGYANGGAVDTVESSQVVPANAPPRISPLGAASVNEGGVYTANGSFTDPDSTSWNAVADYGDGTPAQTLAPSGNSFTLQHTYADEGSYTVAVTITDNQGAAQTATTTVTVANVAPTVQPITGIPASVKVNTAITPSATFTDPGTLDTHTAVWNWGDGTTSAGTVTETNGSGSVTKSHTYTTPGVYTVTLTVADADGGTTDRTYQPVTVYNPTATALLNVVGVYTSPAGAYSAAPAYSGLATVSITARYANGVPSGTAGINLLAGNFTFNSNSITALVISNGTATLRGTGTASGVSGTSTFLVTAKDSTDTFRMQIKNPAGQIIYDTQPGAADMAVPTTAASSVFMQQ